MVQSIGTKMPARARAGFFVPSGNGSALRAAMGPHDADNPAGSSSTIYSGQLTALTNRRPFSRSFTSPSPSIFLPRPRRT